MLDSEPRRRRIGHPATRRSRTGWASSLVLVAAAAGAAPALAADVDWRTYGFTSSRASINPYERSLGPAQARSLRLRWSVHLGGGTVSTQPLVASNVRISPTQTRDVVYAGSQAGRVVAMRAATGQTIWSRQLASVHVPGCFTYGVFDTPVLDRGRGSIYLVDGSGTAYELGLATGRIRHRWSLTHPMREQVWSGLTLVRGKLYVPVASTCNDMPPYRGRVEAIDTATSKRVGSWDVTAGDPAGGGGIWGWAGVSADPRHDALYVATGNALSSKSEHTGYAEHVVRLNGNLKVVASHYPGVNGFDADFGSTPAPYRVPGCPAQLAVGNKYGQFFVYERDRLGRGPVQEITLGGSGEGTLSLLGVAAFWKAQRMLYVSNPVPHGRFVAGLLAFRVGSDCRLALAWQKPGPRQVKSSPTVAGGVVYYGTGADRKVVAFDAKTGKRLWDSGNAIGGAVFNAPSVVGGRVYVPSFDGRVYAFAPAARRAGGSSTALVR